MNLSALILTAGTISYMGLPATLVPQIPVVTPRALTSSVRPADAAKTAELEASGDEAFSIGNAPLAEMYYRQARASAQMYRQTKPLASCSGKIAVILAENGKLAESKQMSLQALSCYRQLHISDINHAALLQNLGWVSSKLGNVEESKLWYREAIKAYDSIGSRSSHLLSAVCARRIARLCIESGDAKTAVHYYKQCLPLLEKYCSDPEFIVFVRIEYLAARQLLRQQSQTIKGN